MLLDFPAPSARAAATTLRSYNRPLDPEGSRFETWDATVERAQVTHQRNLWTMAGGTPDQDELEKLRGLGLARRSLVAGRTLWLGGTEYAYSRPACQFNCAYTEVASVFDLVDVAWLLLNGSGVGFRPQVGTLHGYVRPVPEIKILHGDKGPYDKGDPDNAESFDGGTWTIRVGDSAAAWAKCIGKLFAMMRGDVRRLVVDGRNCRGAGGRLEGYGWICNGFQPLADAITAMHDIRNRQAGNLLDEIDIMDVVNWIGTILSSRRSAQITLLDSTNPQASRFERAKFEYWKSNPQRRQSNNSDLFWSKPAKSRILELLYNADECGGDPGIVNAEAARLKAPWFAGFNPCAEILLGKFCNLVTSALPRFPGYSALERAVYLIARANYRQTCVDLRDGILQPAWHQQNDALRLCGVSLTGIVMADWLTDHQIRRLRNAAIYGAYSMADELGLPRPKAVTTIKPEGTSSKICDVTEGLHRPLGRFIFNSINFSIHDPIVPILEAAGYRTFPNPNDPNNVLVVFPLDYSGVHFDRVGGVEVNLEPATVQLDRYLRWTSLWCDHNASCTVSYGRDEIPAIADWLDQHWDRGYIATAFLRRADPTKTAKDLGHPYLPQEVVTEATFREYAGRLRTPDLSRVSGIYEIDAEECSRGVCPTR